MKPPGFSAAVGTTRQECQQLQRDITRLSVFRLTHAGKQITSDAV